MYIDPNCNLWSNKGKGAVYSFEVCDPVEAPTYDVAGVSVSNFVTPAWFDPLAPSTAQFDKLGLLHAAILAPEGRLPGLGSAGKEHQKQGDAFPEWRTAMKAGPKARTELRRSQVEGFYA